MKRENFFQKEQDRKRLVRKASFRKQKERILIVCEGEKTEPNYFKDFRLSNVEVRTSKGGDAKRVVQKAIGFYKEGEYDKVYCVFDRDIKPEFPNPERFKSAFLLAKEYINFTCIYSNDAFELWYILHYTYLNYPKSRMDYIDILSRKLGFRYKKNMIGLYDYLFSRQHRAIVNAKNLLKSYKHHDPERDNPSTNVFLLVEELNNWL